MLTQQPRRWLPGATGRAVPSRTGDRSAESTAPLGLAIVDIETSS